MAARSEPPRARDGAATQLQSADPAVAAARPRAADDAPRHPADSGGLGAIVAAGERVDDATGVAGRPAGRGPAVVADVVVSATTPGCAAAGAAEALMRLAQDAKQGAQVEVGGADADPLRAGATLDGRIANFVTETSGTNKRKAAHPAPSGNVKKKRASGDIAAKREIEKFVRWIPTVTTPDTMPTNLSGIGCQKVGQDFIAFGNRMREKAITMGMKAGQASRVQHVLENSDTFAELYYKTILCFMPIKDGARNAKYELKHCKACKAAGLFKPSGHDDCPYCHACFVASGWKKACVLKKDCKEMH